MTERERQITLETRMYRKKSFGQEKYCRHCWACEYHRNCIALPTQRGRKQLCVKAENRMKGKPTDDPLLETLKNCEKRERPYFVLKLGLSRKEINS